MQQRQGGMDDSKQQLLSLNGLDYRLSPSLSVATQRTHRAFPAPRNEYQQGVPIQFVCSSGARYVDPTESYIQFDLDVDLKANAAVLGSTRWLTFSGARETGSHAGSYPSDHYGTAMNLFQTFRWVHAAGTELERVENLAAWANHNRRWMCSEGYLHRQGATSGLDVTGNRPGTDGPATTDGSLPNLGENGTVTFEYKKLLVPLSEVSDAFCQDQLIPSFLIAGSQLEFQTSGEAKMPFTFINEAGEFQDDVSVTGWRMKNPRIVLSTITLTDAVQRAMSNVSAASGLEYSFEAVFSQVGLAGAKNTSVQISRALSRANCVWAFPTTDTRVAGGAGNPYMSEPLEEAQAAGVKYQIQLGAEFLPTQPVEGSWTAYWHALQAFNRINPRGRDTTSVSPDEMVYWGAGPVSPERNAYKATGTPFVIAQTLERSSTLAQSGTAISAQRTLNFNVEWSGPDERRLLYVYVHYVKLITAFLDNAVVRS